MELIGGPPLDEFIRAREELMSERQAVEVIHQIAQALGYAQERDIIHRDVKAQNILLQPIDIAEGENQFPFIPKLVDLGLARFQYASADDEQLTIQGELIGTPSAMAPEQFENPEGVDHRTDIYSLGCVLYFMLTGQPAFSFKTLTEIMRVKLIGEAPNPAKLRSSLSDLTVKLARSMMAKKPADRPQTYKELMTRCEDILRRLERVPGRGGPISKLVRKIGGSWSGGGR
jgi:serine/threonine-protein kinase